MKGFYRGIIVFSLIWIVARSAIYLLPGDPAEFLVHEALVKVDVEELREKMDLKDSPVSRIFSLPAPNSLIRNEKTFDLLSRAWKHTGILTALSLWISLPLTFGLLFFHFQGGKRRTLANTISLILASIPILVLGPTLLRILPAQNPFLPALTLALHLTGFWYRTLARRLEKQLPLSSVDGARALGFPEIRIFSRNLLAPTLGGFIAFFGAQLGFLLNGSILVETLYQWNGIGSLLADAILSRDYPVLEAGMMSAALFTLIAQQTGYAFQSWWDPRIS
ncbi:MAG: ABC transporter permease [Bdellovibrionales bacterium]|nr:ABC transporter permease [Bdellovibrionales bacterium]